MALTNAEKQKRWRDRRVQSWALQLGDMIIRLASPEAMTTEATP
jgi:hypothetical protein